MVPMNRWLYSTPNDQFGAKAYSTPAPTVPPQRVSSARSSTVPRQQAFIAVVGHRRTALDVEQDVVGGIADLTGEQAERVDLACG